MSSRDKTKKIAFICDALRKSYGAEAAPEVPDLMELMLLSILGDRLSKPKAEHVMKRYRTTFVDWNEVRVSTGSEIMEEAGCPEVDDRLARNLRSALDRLYHDRADFKLDFLREKTYADLRSYLLDTLGLAPRPAARLMLLGFQKPALPLSDEVKRISDRVGLVDPSWPMDRAQKSLERIVPGSRMLEFYQLVTCHGEAICLPSTPKCSHCALRRICDYPKKRRAGAEGPSPKAAAKSGSKMAKRKARS